MKYDIAKGDKIDISDERMRVFKAWASVEIPDKQGEIVSIDDLKKLMPILMDRGGMIMDSHTNRPVGKILNWEVREKDGSSGIYITGKIFDHYQLDNEVWESIKKGKIKGLSIGGRGITQGTTDINSKDGSGVKKLNISELYEISVTPNPANPEATIEAVNAVAKQIQDVQKPFGAWKNFDDCVRDMKDKGYSDDSAKRICGALKARLESKGLLSKDEFELVLTTESQLQSNEKEEKKMDEKKEIGVPTPTPPETTGGEPKKVEASPKPKMPEEDKKKENGTIDLKSLVETIAAMGTKLDKVIELLSSSAKSKEDEKEEDEDEKEKKMMEKVKNDVIKELGITVVGTPRPQGPAPVAGNRDKPANEDLALKIAKGEVKVSFADLDRKAKQAKLNEIRKFLDETGGV